MREVFGDGRLVMAERGFAIEAVGLGAPALLLDAADGSPVPDLAPQLGKVLSYTGLLRSTGDNLEYVAFHFAEILEPQIETPVSPMWAMVSGNLGKAPELNPSKDRIVASIAYDKIGDAASWLRISAYSYLGISNIFANLESGSALIAYGAIESYDYKDKPRAQLALRGYQLLKAGSGPKAPLSLASARSSADTAPHAFDEAA
jgi:hypothetical protein